MKITTFILLLIIFSCSSEELSEKQQKLKKDAIVLNSLSNLNSKVYNEIAEYEIIMIGEMHGTNEPAEFAYGLCDLITKYEENVILGMEIIPSQMNDFSDTMSIDQLKNRKFFVGENSSGMNGQAWLNLIDKSNQNQKIIIHFFDHQEVAPRDSSMYNAICGIRENYPNSKIITLSGNLHNWLEPFNDNLMLGGYLIKDTINYDRDKIMSIMHLYNQGTMLNNMGNGLELRTIEGKENIFNKTISSKKLFCKNIFEDQNHYTHILYTDKVTHSNVIE